MDRLPGWVTDNRTAVAREAAPYRNLSFEERARATAAACRGAARQLASRPVAALRELRRVARTRS